MKSLKQRITKHLNLKDAYVYTHRVPIGLQRWYHSSDPYHGENSCQCSYLCSGQRLQVHGEKMVNNTLSRGDKRETKENSKCINLCCCLGKIVLLNWMVVCLGDDCCCYCCYLCSATAVRHLCANWSKRLSKFAANAKRTRKKED